MRLITLILAVFLVSGCTAMMVGGGSGSSSTTSSKTTTASDAAIRAQLRNRLAAAPGLGMFDVTIAVDDGHVTLAGEVQSYAAREAAEKIAVNTDGVEGVDNNIKVNVSK